MIDTDPQETQSTMDKDVRDQDIQINPSANSALITNNSNKVEESAAYTHLVHTSDYQQLSVHQEIINYQNGNDHQQLHDPQSQIYDSSQNEHHNLYDDHHLNENQYLNDHMHQNIHYHQNLDDYKIIDEHVEDHEKRNNHQQLNDPQYQINDQSQNANNNLCDDQHLNDHQHTNDHVHQEINHHQTMNDGNGQNINYHQNLDNHVGSTSYYIQDELTEYSHSCATAGNMYCDFYPMCDYNMGNMASNSNVPFSPAEDWNKFYTNKIDFPLQNSCTNNTSYNDNASCHYSESPTRGDATQRERNRMHLLNDAFEELRRAVPRPSNANEHQKLSKIATLRFAIQYISAMICVLKESGAEVKLVLDGSICDRRGRRRGRLRRNCGIYKRPLNS